MQELGNDDSGEASEVPASWLLNGIARRIPFAVDISGIPTEPTPTKLLASAGCLLYRLRSFVDLFLPM